MAVKLMFPADEPPKQAPLRHLSYPDETSNAALFSLRAVPFNSMLPAGENAISSLP